jgi:predicted RNA methylase
MGWSSGTEIFDVAVCELLKTKCTTEEKKKVIKALIKVMWDHDWDCEYDSNFIDVPLVRQVFKDLNPRMFEDD